MTMSPSLRRLMLTVHVTASVGWIGALAVFLAHAIAAATSADRQIVAAASIAMVIAAWYVILPLSLASVASGIVQALGTAWGLVRHYWVLFKLVLTSVATAVLLLKLPDIDAVARLAEAAQAQGLRVSLLVHAAGGVAILLAAAVLAIYKPAGRVGTAPPPWVKAFGGIVAALFLIVALMIVIGEHGPAMHAR
jgi:hypothetical protein